MDPKPLNVCEGPLISEVPQKCHLIQSPAKLASGSVPEKPGLFILLMRDVFFNL
jgi:hypothetical protein